MSKAINLHGLDNVKKHIDNLKSFNLPVVVALNKFPTDSANFIHELKDFCQSCGANFATSDVFAEGATGGFELANAVLDSISDVTLNFTYDLSDSIE